MGALLRIYSTEPSLQELSSILPQGLLDIGRFASYGFLYSSIGRDEKGSGQEMNPILVAYFSVLIGQDGRFVHMNLCQEFHNQIEALAVADNDHLDALGFESVHQGV
jgi:hypothetical protein